jgi:hypothetical protein
MARPLVRFVCTIFVALVSTEVMAQLIISEFRLRGPGGAADEYVELYNNSAADLPVTASSGSGFAVVASDGVIRCTISNGTVIPARGHYLCVNSVAYSLASYPAGDGTTAIGDATFAADIPDNTGIALFDNNTDPAGFILANRLDAAGPTAEPNPLYREGAGYPAIVPFNLDAAWVRDACGKAGAANDLGPCTQAGLPKDSNDNAVDFFFVDTNGTDANGGQRLGTPGPENLSSPVSNTSSITNAPLDPCVSEFAPPNLVRDFTTDPPNNSTFGTVDIRRTFTNNTGVPLTRLRYRIVDLGTFPSSFGFADLRPRTSTAVIVTVDRGPCGSGTSNVPVEGTTLEQPPSQPNGGGFNSSLGVGTVTLVTPLAPGASVDVRFLFGVQQPGDYRVGLVVEGLPEGGGAADFLFLVCHTDGCDAPTVTSIVRADADPTGAATVDFTVTFSEAVTGVDVSDFVLNTTGSIAGASVTSVVGAGTTWTVTVDTGTGGGDGTIRLDVIDDDTIIDADTNPLGGPGGGNGTFNSGETYTVVRVPSVVSITRLDPNPSNFPSVRFLVTFSESVTGVDATDFAIVTGIAGTSITDITGAGATHTVTVNTGGGMGTIQLDLIDDDTIIDADAHPLGGPGAGNGSFTTGEVYTIVAVNIPTMDPRIVILLALVLAGIAMTAIRAA